MIFLIYFFINFVFPLESLTSYHRKPLKHSKELCQQSIKISVIWSPQKYTERYILYIQRFTFNRHII